jgi:hypothetical protein
MLAPSGNSIRPVRLLMNGLTAANVMSCSPVEAG